MTGILLYLATGSLAGFLAGLLGVGGGIIVVPALVYTFSYLAMPASATMHMAASTSLAAMIFTMIVATITQQKKHMINWQVFRNFAPASIMGVIAGVAIASLLPTHMLKLVFGVFMLLIGIKMLAEKKAEEKPEVLPHRSIQLLVGFLASALSGLLGIGGGAFLIPVLLRFGLTTHRAAATSSACTLLLSIVGTITFVISGWHISNLPSGSTGYVYWPAALAIAATSVVFVPFGTKLAHRLSGNTLKRVFAVFLLLVGINMVW